jgi:hypothetical protein
MFERSFAWAMRNGSRILFAAAILILLTGLLSIVWETKGTRDGFGSVQAYMVVTMFLSQLVPSAYLFLGAVLADRLRRD